MSADMPPAGRRFSHLYLQHPELLPDSTRMRRRLGHLIGLQDLDSFPGFLARELGIEVAPYDGKKTYYWPGFLERIELRDVLDTVTLRFQNLAEFNNPTATKRNQNFFLVHARRIFSEENVRYTIDDEGGVHFVVDAEFGRVRVSAIANLEGPRYAGVRGLFEQAFEALDRTPPDGKAGIRSVFFANEGLFRLMFEDAHQLSGGELQKHLAPRLDALYAERKPAQHVARKQMASFREWVDAAHFYRHEPGSEEPAQPPLDLALHMISQGGSILRWLAGIDRQSTS